MPRETRRQRGQRRGRSLITDALSELHRARVTANLGQPSLARQLGMSQSNYSRIEAGKVPGLSVMRLSEMASLLGLELSVRLYPAGDPIRDKGQQGLDGRFEAILADAWTVTNEALLPGPGDLRAWDKLLRLTGETRHLVGVDLETRIRDIQALVRRTRLRERDGAVDVILIVLSDSGTNRILVGQLRDALGPDYSTDPGAIVRALHDGQPLPGSGVMLV
jgi:transcriptional regulator with XRE-family HTH domain